MVTCAYDGCNSLTAKPSDLRYRYCKVHQNRKMRRRSVRKAITCHYPGCTVQFRPAGRGRFRYCVEHRGNKSLPYMPAPEWRRRVPAGLVGVIHVLQVATDLVIRGFDIWQAVGNGCPCDLIAGIGRQLYRVEVTTGRWSAGDNPRLIHPHVSAVERWDVLAVVTECGITYQPKLPHSGGGDPAGVSSADIIHPEKIGLMTVENLQRSILTRHEENNLTGKG